MIALRIRLPPSMLGAMDGTMDGTSKPSQRARRARAAIALGLQSDRPVLVAAMKNDQVRRNARVPAKIVKVSLSVNMLEQVDALVKELRTRMGKVPPAAAGCSRSQVLRAALSLGLAARAAPLRPVETRQIKAAMFSAERTVA